MVEALALVAMELWSEILGDGLIWTIRQVQAPDLVDQTNKTYNYGYQMFVTDLLSESKKK